jgi:hypothetical protein
MSNRWIIAGTLSLAALLPTAAFAHPTPEPARAAESADDSSVWVRGHFETRERRTLIPAETRQERVPARYEEIVTPAVTERTWIPARVERVWVSKYFDFGGWHSAHYEDKVLSPSHFETRILEPERRETRMISDAFWRTVVVRPAHYEVTDERVWVPGHWENN